MLDNINAFLFVLGLIAIGAWILKFMFWLVDQAAPYDEEAERRNEEYWE